MKKIKIKKGKSAKELFHNVWISVRPGFVKFEDITFWKGNYRSILEFDKFKHEKGNVDIFKLPLKEIVDFLSDQPEMDIPDLAKSIAENGVKVPLIILDDGTLLDGNRRYFSCAYLKFKAEEKSEKRPSALDEIPVKVIKKKDIDRKKQYKILAEANFVKDHKKPWTLDVKAKVINDYFDECLKSDMDDEAAYIEIKDVFSLSKSEVKAFIESKILAQEFIEEGKEKEEFRLRGIVQSNFVYFWEFRNKALSEKKSLDKNSLKKIKKLFFKMMGNNRFKKLKQVEPMIECFQDEDEWAELESSGGLNIDQVEANFIEGKAGKSSEYKIKKFLRWLHKHDYKKDLGGEAKGMLKEVSVICNRILND